MGSVKLIVVVFAFWISPSVAYAAGLFDQITKGLLAQQADAAKSVAATLGSERLNAGRPTASDGMPAGTPLVTSNGGQLALPATDAPRVRPLDVAPVSVSRVIREQTDDQRVSVAQALQSDIDQLQAQLEERLAREAKTPEVVTEITALSDALIAKRQALSLALGKQDVVSSAAAESFLNASNPYFLVCGEKVWSRMDPLRWSEVFAPVQPALIRVGRSVGAVMIDGRLAGTAFTVGRGLILTNAHVLRAIADFDAKKRIWRTRGDATVVFDLEYKLGQDVGCNQPNQARSYSITGALFAGTDASNLQVQDKDIRDDLAVLLTGTDPNYPMAVTVASRAPEAFAGKMVLCVIGYPGPPADMTIAERMQYFSGPDTLVPVMPFKRLAGGFSADRAPTADGLFPHLANTANGNSGSPIIDLADGAVIGIHVRGEDRSLATAKNWGIAGNQVLSVLKRAGLSSQ